jgi:hypothetical protein
LVLLFYCKAILFVLGLEFEKQDGFIIKKNNPQTQPKKKQENFKKKKIIPNPSPKTNKIALQ